MTISINPPNKKTPLAAASLIIHESGLILAVSRKTDPSDLGLPGGKLDPGEGFGDACIRETFEETGLEVTHLKPVYAANCGIPKVHVVHWNVTFLCKVKGKIQTSEKGRVVWVSPSRLYMNEAGKKNSFCDYNLDLFLHLASNENGLNSYLNDLPLEPHLVERWSWDR